MVYFIIGYLIVGILVAMQSVPLIRSREIIVKLALLGIIVAGWPFILWLSFIRGRD